MAKRMERMPKFGMDALKDQLRYLTSECGKHEGTVLATLGSIMDPFLHWPASIIKHQSHEHGLLTHTLQVAEHVKELAVNYYVDKPLAIAGALLHDIGKVDEYIFVRGRRPTLRSRNGQLIGHVTMGHARAMSFTDDTELLHIILSHHGRQEWGSPKEPQTREAWLVHLCDMISSRVGGDPDRPNSEVRT